MRIIDKNVVVTGLAPLPDFRQRTKYWMTVGGLFVVAVGFFQFLVTFAIIPISLYRILLFMISLIWPFVVIGMMPAQADPSMPPMYRWIRNKIPPTQWCWPVGYVFWFVFRIVFGGGSLDENLANFWPILFIHAIGGIGLIGLVFWLHDLALRLDLDASAWRCNVVTWMMATWGILVFVTPWKQPTSDGASLIPALAWFYIVVLMFTWFGVLFLFAKSLFDIASHSIWSLKYDRDVEGRIDRVRKKREDYDRERGF